MLSKQNLTARWGVGQVMKTTYGTGLSILTFWNSQLQYHYKPSSACRRAQYRISCFKVLDSLTRFKIFIFLPRKVGGIIENIYAIQRKSSNSKPTRLLRTCFLVKTVFICIFIRIGRDFITRPCSHIEQRLPLQQIS